MMIDEEGRKSLKFWFQQYLKFVKGNNNGEE